MPATDGQLHCDEFIGEVIGIDRLRSLHFDMTGEGSVIVSATFWKEPRDYDPKSFVGFGRTMGFALADVRQKIREHYGR